ncbi:MAG TPA: acyltransferase, partial [Thiopseudomonas sp.]|nr:acyltransferase [Thiopseudomonas sp.]
MKLPKTPVTYRQDIHGLRAWAVIAVLLFHFKIPGASAGFIGVDIFFVISGFLMTAIVVKGLENNNFSLWQFYLARIRRIVPALMALLVVLLVLGWFWLPTPDYQSLGAQSAYSLGFLSNIHFWRSAGYFDTAAQEKWLLHTWSLGIEFQFYVLFPLFVMLLWKIRPQLKTIVWGLGLACFASLALSIVASGWKPTAAFYLLPTRGWELVAGGLAFVIGREVPSLQRYSKPMFWLGFALWVVAAFLIDTSFSWPSGWALLPV